MYNYYISPETRPTEFQNILNTIETTVISHSDQHSLVTRDFNAPGISWETQLVSQPSHPISQKCDYLLDFISFTSLQQCNFIRNLCGNVLGFCLTSLEVVEVSRSNTNLVKPDKFHPPLHISLHSVSLLHHNPLFAHLEAVVMTLLVGTTLVYFTFLITLTGRQ